MIFLQCSVAMGSWVPLYIGETNWRTVVPAEEMNVFACSSIHSNQCFPGSYLMLVTTVAKWRMCLRAMSIVNWGNMATTYFQSWDLFSCRFSALDGPKPADVIKWYTADYSQKLISELARHFVPARAGKPYELGCALADRFLRIRDHYQRNCSHPEELWELLNISTGWNRSQIAAGQAWLEIFSIVSPSVVCQCACILAHLHT